MSCPLPCNSAKNSGLMPERRCRLSVFCVTRNRSLPSRWSSKSDRWEALGATSLGGTRHLGAGRPASHRVHTPSGPRKSGMPESVLIPAPVKTTMCSDPAIHLAIFPTCRWRRCSPIIVSATWHLKHYIRAFPGYLEPQSLRSRLVFFEPRLAGSEWDYRQFALPGVHGFSSSTSGAAGPRRSTKLPSTETMYCMILHTVGYFPGYSPTSRYKRTPKEAG